MKVIKKRTFFFLSFFSSRRIGPPIYVFLDITCEVFQRLEFPWNWIFRETWLSVTLTWNSKSHGNSSFTETPVHGNSSFTETSPTLISSIIMRRYLWGFLISECYELGHLLEYHIFQLKAYEPFLNLYEDAFLIRLLLVHQSLKQK